MNCNNKIKAVIIGFAHMHVNEVAQYITSEAAMELCAASDTFPTRPELPDTHYTRKWNMQNIRDNYCSSIYTDYKKMLDTEKPDVAFILSETTKKPEIVEECAKRGVDVSIEKPMAVSMKEALKIKASVEKYGIFAMVNWPLTWRPYLHTIKKALDDGKIGRLLKIRFLIGNTGPIGKGALHRGVTERAEAMSDENRTSMWWYNKSEGGGALLDFVSYGCMLSHWLCNENAVSVCTAQANLDHSFADICDDGVAIVKRPSSIAVLEGTWTTPSRAIPAGPTVFGSEGVIECKRDENGNVVPFAFDIYGNDIEIPPAHYPEHMKTIATMYIHHKNGGKIHPTLDFTENLKIMSVLDAASKSAESGKTELCGENI